MREMSLAEVEEVVRDLKSNEAPGLNGFTSEFFKAGWKFLGDNIHELVEHFRYTQWNWSGLNATFLMLIPTKGTKLDPGGF